MSNDESLLGEYGWDDETYCDPPHPSVRQGLAHLDEFMVGGSDTELMNACSHSRRLLAETDFLIAVDSLARGERDEAIDLFNKVLELKVFAFYRYHWSLAFLARLIHDE